MEGGGVRRALPGGDTLDALILHPSDHSLKPILFDMLGGHPGEVTLTENFAMLPTSAVSGFYFGHPDATYFGVARIGQDQLHEYAERRGVDLETAKRWLRPNLD